MKKILILSAILLLASCTQEASTPTVETTVQEAATTVVSEAETMVDEATQGVETIVDEATQEIDAMVDTATEEVNTMTEDLTTQEAVVAEPTIPTAPVVPEDKSEYPIEAGNTVSVHYTLSLADGVKKESSLDLGEPFEFVIGAGQVIKGWDEGLLGMKIGETKSLEVEAVDAYGEYDETRVQLVPKEELAQFEEAGIELVAGELLPTQFGNFKIKEATETGVLVDINHELAGQKLFFDVEIIDIK